MLPIASIAKGLTLKGRGDVDTATRAFESTLSSCDHEVQCFVECVQVSHTPKDRMQLSIVYSAHCLFRRRTS